MPKFSFALNDFSKDYLPFEFHNEGVAGRCFLRIVVKNNKAFFLYAQLPDYKGISVTDAKYEIIQSSIECIQNKVNFNGQPILERKVAFNLLEKVIVSLQKRWWENEEKQALYNFLTQNGVWIEHYPEFVQSPMPGSFRVTLGTDYDEWIVDFISEHNISGAFRKFINTLNEKVGGSSDISSNAKHIEGQVRNCARQIWQEYPDMSVDNMLARPEIKYACGDKNYDEETLRSWILPHIVAHDELARLKTLPAWKLIEAVAVWLDLNPFVMEKYKQNKIENSIWDLGVAINPDCRADFLNLLEVSTASIAAGTLNAVKEKDQYYVTPRDFHAWAKQNTSGAQAGSVEFFFSELQRTWDAEIDVSERNEEETAKPLSRVDQKKEEITRILQSIKKLDPEFDRCAMPGRKEDFHALCKKINGGLFFVESSTFNDYLKGLCTFLPGARETHYYKKIASNWSEIASP